VNFHTIVGVFTNNFTGQVTVAEPGMQPMKRQAMQPLCLTGLSRHDAHFFSNPLCAPASPLAKIFILVLLSFYNHTLPM
jgi:hypothetical protein